MLPKTTLKLFSNLNREVCKHIIRGESTLYDFDPMLKFFSDKPKPEYSFRPIEDYGRFISTRSSLREAALTRQITTQAFRVGGSYLSLAEGMPTSAVFPFSELSFSLTDGSRIVLKDDELTRAMQYIPTQGLPELLSYLRGFQQEIHQPPLWDRRDILATSGGQWGIYSVVELLLNPGDPILIPMHTYTGALISLKPYQPEIVSVPEDDHGLVPELLESILEDRLKSNQSMPKVLYVVPTGSNPTGTVIPEERRIKLYELACRFDFLIVEDDPYMFMNYTEVPVPSFLSMDEEGRVIRIDSLSKVLSSGLRTGWVTAPIPLLNRIELHLQADHLHAATLSQTILHRLLNQWGRSGLAAHLVRAREGYQSRRDLLHSALLEAAPPVTWRIPDAGMFLWMRLPVNDVYEMVFKTAFDRGLMLIPGQACSYDIQAPSQYLRLAFSKIQPDDMKQAARILSDVIRDELQKSPLRSSATQR